ncbi:nitroreductase family protein [Candidatus Oleimmundimicrobium sp.]|uniref:nitroreductase family protein n=1 Tax=Candidatus Oleimmundimicrobium sp. TaxID=3060597 RepID=UPI002716E659|nr:nitroreductase family protein [Candidatus Oleimmundimicrobium sp.]MDO8886552.1 nitroreductase family protein [Candidatus Oleimmundimicrobium sp.]
METIEAINDRRSIRHFEDEPIPDDILRQILKAGCYAPSAHNSQPWKFIVLKGDKKNELGEAFLNISKEERYKEYTGFYVNRLLKYAGRIVKESPITIAVFNKGSFCGSASKYFRQSKKEVLHIMEVQSIAAAIENMLLACHDQGLGAVWLGVPLLVPQELIEDFFNTKNELMAIIPMGYPSKKRAIEKKIDIDKHIIYFD